MTIRDEYEATVQAELHGLRAVRDAAKEVPDPQEDGFCESCNDYPIPSIKVGEVYEWEHKPSCWYGRLQNVLIASRPERTEVKS